MKNRIKNFIIIIELLIMAALLYFTCGVFLHPHTRNDGFFSMAAAFFGIDSPSLPQTTQTDINMSVYPLRAAVGYNGALYAAERNIYETSNIYNKIKGIVSEAIGSAGEPYDVSDEDFCKALDGNMAYLGFDGNIPLFLFGAAQDGQQIEKMSSIVLSADKNEIVLYYRRDDGTIKGADTAARSRSLISALSEFSADNAEFAFKNKDIYDGLFPETIIFYQKPYCPYITAESPDLQSDGAVISALLDMFGYNPYTVKKYADSNGAMVYVQELSTIRVYRDGTVDFSLQGRLEGESAAANLSYDGTYGNVAAFLDNITGKIYSVYNSFGFSEIYLKDFSYDYENDSGYILFGCSVSGIPVINADGRHSIRIDFDRNKITSAHMILRKYQQLKERSALLPFEQLAAVIKNNVRDPASDTALKINARYMDDRQQKLCAQWFYE